MRTINESTEENVAAECSSALRGAEVIPPFSSTPATPSSSTSCASTLLTPQRATVPHGNRRSDEPEPLQFTEPAHECLVEETAPSTASTANRAFTRTGLIPRALFFGDARRAPTLETEKSFVPENSAAGSHVRIDFQIPLGTVGRFDRHGVWKLRRWRLDDICVYIGLFISKRRIFVDNSLVIVMQTVSNLFMEECTEADFESR